MRIAIDFKWETDRASNDPRTQSLYLFHQQIASVTKTDDGKYLAVVKGHLNRRKKDLAATLPDEKSAKIWAEIRFELLSRKFGYDTADKIEPGQELQRIERLKMDYCTTYCRRVSKFVNGVEKDPCDTCPLTKIQRIAKGEQL